MAISFQPSKSDSRDVVLFLFLLIPGLLVTSTSSHGKSVRFTSSWKMDEIGFLLLVLSVLNLSMISHGVEEVPDVCPINARLNLSGEIPDALGSVKKSGYVFPPGSTWHQDDVMFGCICYDKPCLPLCCPLEMVLVNKVCVADDQVTSFTFPSVYSTNLSVDGTEVDAENFHIVVSEPCGSRGAYLLEPEEYPDDGFYLMKNGSIYLPRMLDGTMWNIDNYCFWRSENSSVYLPRVCFPEVPPVATRDPISIIGMAISVPFLIITFIVYSILPEMKNIHGLTLRGYVGCLLVAYTTLIIIQITNPMPKLPCIFAAFTTHFSFLASFFWLNVMCFDIWWTFGGLRPLRGNIKQRDSRKFLMYSAYALGCSSLLSGICMIMDFVPGIPDTLIRPEFAVESECWFKTYEATAIYFYGPMGVTIICNVFFFVSTAVKIIRHKKSTAHNLKRTNSKIHGDENKQWFNLYLKLFIVMGINWSMEIISWLYKDLEYVWYVTDLGNALQGLIIFVIFICKKKIMRLLVKRFGCQAPNFISQSSMTYAHRSSTLQSVTTYNSSVCVRREDQF